MSLISELQELTGLTHLQMAQYAGVPRSLITMSETGLRELPTPAHLKLTRLYQLAYDEKKAGEKKSKQHEKQQKKDLDEKKKQAALLKAKAKQMEKKLAQSQKSHEQAALLFSVISKMKSNKDVASLPEGDQHWLNNLEISNRVRLQKKAKEKLLHETKHARILAMADAAELQVQIILKVVG